VRLPAGVCRLVTDSDVLVDQILAWDNELFREDLGILPEALQQEVRGALLDDGRLLIQVSNGTRQLNVTGTLARLQLDESAGQ